MRITEGQLRSLIRQTIQENLQQTQTPEFKRWFGNSVIVDSNGDPVRLFHGSRSVFRVFKPSSFGKYGPGIYLTALKDMASNYATGRGADVEQEEDRNPSVYAVYARVVNPLIIAESDSGPVLRTVRGRLSPAHEALQEKVRTIADAVSYFSSKDSPFTEEVQALGHDGIIVDHSGALTDPAAAAEFAAAGISALEVSMVEVVVFSPMQLKSAIGNIGQFDPEDPDITKESRSRLSGRGRR